MAYTALPDVVAIAAGTLDSFGPTTLENGSGSGLGSSDGSHGDIPKPGLHIFLKEKADWFEVPKDGLKRYEAHFL